MDNKAEGGRNHRSLERTPVFLEVVLVIDDIWSVHVSLSLITTPRNFVE